VRDLFHWTSENVGAVKSTVPPQMRGEIIEKLKQPEEHCASDVHTKALDEAHDVYDPAELAEVDDEL
jgi:hypothetical protein